MKLKLKQGETIRIETDGDAPVMIYAERNLVQITVQPHRQPLRIVVADKNVKMEMS